jgi:hypothetical protein
MLEVRVVRALRVDEMRESGENLQARLRVYQLLRELPFRAGYVLGV